MNKISKREKIKLMYGGRCAYSGTVLEHDWEADHVEPIRRNSFGYRKELDTIENIVPTQKAINRYKGNCSFVYFRYLIETLPSRVKKLPKSPRTEKSAIHKRNLLQLQSYFIDFDGKFYFEKL